MSSILRSSVVCFSIAATLAFAGTAPVFAADKAKTLTPQQQRMSDCNAKAAGKKGDERKTFMSSCLKGESGETTAQQTQQEKMKSCNADASKKSLKGDERKTFMSTCLKGDGAAAAAAH